MVNSYKVLMTRTFHYNPRVIMECLLESGHDEASALEWMINYTYQSYSFYEELVMDDFKNLALHNGNIYRNLNLS